MNRVKHMYEEYIYHDPEKGLQFLEINAELKSTKL